MSKSVVENSNFVYSESEIRVTLKEGKQLTEINDIYDLFTEAVKMFVGAFVGSKLKDPNVGLHGLHLSSLPVMLFSIADTKEQSVLIKFGYDITEKEYQFISECTPERSNLVACVGINNSICKCYTFYHGRISPSNDDILQYNLYRAFQKGILGGYVVNKLIKCDIASKLVMGYPQYFETLLDASSCRGLYEMKDGSIEPFYLHRGYDYNLTIEKAKEIIINYDELVSEPFNYKIHLNQYVTVDSVRGNILYYDIVIERGSLGSVLVSLLDSNSDMTTALRHNISVLPEGVAESVRIYKGHLKDLKYPNWIDSKYKSDAGEFLEAYDKYVETTELACATEIKINLDKAFK